MSTTADLMGLGMPAALGGRLGFTPATLVTTGTTAGTAAAIQTKLTILTTAGSQTGAILPSSASLGSIYVVTNPTSTTPLPSQENTFSPRNQPKPRPAYMPASSRKTWRSRLRC